MLLDKNCNTCQSNGTAYEMALLAVLSYDNKGIYKINLANSADVTLISFGFTATYTPLGGSGSCENYLVKVGDRMVMDMAIEPGNDMRQDEYCQVAAQKMMDAF